MPPTPRQEPDPAVPTGPHVARQLVQSLEDQVVDLDGIRDRDDRESQPASDDTAPPVPGTPEPPD